MYPITKTTIQAVKHSSGTGIKAFTNYAWKLVPCTGDYSGDDDNQMGSGRAERSAASFKGNRGDG